MSTEEPEDPASQREELRLCALDSVRWRVLTGIFLLATFGGSHPHEELLKNDPALLRVAVTAVLEAGTLLPDHWLAFCVVSALAYAVLEQTWLRRLERPTLRWIGTGVAIVVLACVAAFHLPLVRMLVGDP